MRTLFIGGGPGCCEVLQLVEQGRLSFLGIEVAGVVDRDPEAPALAFARKRGWPTAAHLKEGLALPDLELVIELTGSDEVLERAQKHVPPGVRVIDHVMARVFWDLEKVAGDLRGELRARSDLQLKLTRDRQQLQDVLDAVPDMIVELDRDMKVIRVNQRFERMTGKYRDRIRGKRITAVFGEDDADNWAAEFQTLFDEVQTHGRPATLPSRKWLKSGRRAHFQITANPIFDEDLDIVRVVVSAREVTEEVRLKRETEDAARRFRQIVDAVHGLIAIKDLQGRYVMVNPFMARVLELAPEDMIGKTARDVFPAEVIDEIEALDKKTLEENARQVSEEVVTLDGVDRIFVCERLPLTDYRGTVTGLCTVRQDRTRRRRMAQEMVQTERLAAIGKLSAGVAHEINNPLSGILTFAQDLLLESDEDDPLRDDYQLIVNETLRCRRIVRELLEFSRQRSPQRRAVELWDLVATMVHMLGRQATFHNIEFDVDLPEGLPPLFVDPQQVQQVLLNLFTNACDAMDGVGTVHIRADEADGGRAVAIAVADTGCGIPEADLKYVFEPFHSTKGEQGHGLGLTAVQSVVDRHGGRIDVESEVGKGTTFFVTLPAVRE